MAKTIDKQTLEALLKTSTKAQIAERFGITAKSVTRLITQYGLPNPPYVQSGETKQLRVEAIQAARGRDPSLVERQMTRYGTTFVAASGSESAAPLALIHGAGANSAMWAGDVGEYSRHYRVYAIDLLGEPGKSAQVRPDWNSPAYAEWLGDVLDALKVKRAILIGLSQGAWTALKFATSRPERVDKLALLTPGGITPDRISFALRAIPLSFMGRWGIERINRMMFGPQPIPAEVNETIKLILTHFKPRIGVLPIFLDEELRRLTMPTLLLIGQEDALRDARKVAERMRKLVPELTAKIIPQAGHALYNTTSHVMPFLIRLDADAAPVRY